MQSYATGVNTDQHNGTLNVQTDAITVSADNPIGIYSLTTPTTTLQKSVKTNEDESTTTDRTITLNESPETNIKAGPATATGKNNVQGVYIGTSGSTISAETGNINAVSDTNAVGASISINPATNMDTSIITDKGHTDISSTDIITVGDPGKVSLQTGDIFTKGSESAVGVHISSTAGEVNVKADSAYAESDNHAVGISALVNSADDLELTNVGNTTTKKYLGKTTTGTISIVTTDITAKGENSVGILATGEVIDDDKEPSSMIKIVADGTVSGDDVAIKVVEESTINKYDTEHINLTVWSAKENENKEIIRVVKQETKQDHTTTETTDKEASAAMESRINYIVKVANGVMPKIAVTTAKGNTVVIDNNTEFHTANENEQVTLNITLEEGEILKGVYYNADDTSSLTGIDKLVRNSSGGYVLNMLRGGGMLIGLEIHKHTPGAAVTEIITAATCHAEGASDSVVYCSDPECGEELSRTRVTLPKLSHVPGGVSIENRVEPTATTEGGYDEVVYCTLCGDELSRSHVNLGFADPEPDPDPTPDPTPDSTPDPTPDPTPDLTLPPAPSQNPQTNAAHYIPVDENTLVHGVMAAYRLSIDAVFAILGTTLEAENATLKILHMDEILNVDELARFEQLGAKDQLNVLLKVLIAGGVVQSGVNEMSDDAAALAADIETRIGNMTEEEKTALADQMRKLFNVRTETVDGAEHQVLSVEMEVTINGQTTIERYNFFEDNGNWRLYMIETAEN